MKQKGIGLGRSVMTALVITVGTVAPSFAAGTWVGPYPVNYLEIGADGVYFQNAVSGLPNYDAPSVEPCIMSAIKFPFAEAPTDEVLSVGLSAQATGAKVKFYVTGCDGYIKAIGIATDPAW